MDDKNLPPGWVVRKSKKYPDRVYYFNINTGLSSWEYPDILESIASKNAGNPSDLVPPCTPAVVQPTPKPVDKPETRKMQNPGHNVEFQGRSAPRAKHNLSKSSKRQSPSKNKLASSSPVRNKAMQRVDNKSSTKGSVSKAANVKNDFVRRKLAALAKRTGKLEDVLQETKSKTSSTSTLKTDKVKQVKPSSTNTLNIGKVESVRLSSTNSLNKDKVKLLKSSSTSAQNTERVKSVKQSLTRTLNSDKQKTVCAQNTERVKSVKTSTSTLNTDKVKSVKSVKPSGSGNSHKATVLNLNTKLDTKLKPIGKVSQPAHIDTSPSKSRQKYATVTPKAKGSKLVHPKQDVNANSLKSPSAKVSEKTPTVKAKTEETITDLRKVVRAMQHSLKSSRDVSLKDNKISNVKPSARRKSDNGPRTGHSGYMGNNDLTVHTELKLDADVQVVAAPVAPAIVIDEPSPESCKNTEFKVFIGDKNKLLNIQSWINNIQEGSASNSPAQEEWKMPHINVNESVDSGYTSPFTQRGWPGKFTASDITSRDICAMDIDECLMPAPGDVTTIQDDLQEPEAMDIDEVLVEIRNEVKKDCNRKLSSPIGWSEPDDDVIIVRVDPPKTVLVVLDTNVIISNLCLIKNMKSYTLKGNIKPTLFIPWIVLCELDRLKNRPSVSELSRQGINYFKDLFTKKDPQVMGQTPKQSDEATAAFHSACNDDMILQACLQCQQKFNQVVLFTNDNNLILKSLVLSIPASNYRGIYDEIRKAAESLSGTTSMSNGHVIDKQTGSSPSQNFTPTQTGTQHISPLLGSHQKPVPSQTFTPIQTGSHHISPLLGRPVRSVPSQTFTPIQTGTQDISSLIGCPLRAVPSQNFTPIQNGSQHIPILLSSNHRPVPSQTFTPIETGSQHIPPLIGSHHRPVPSQTGSQHNTPLTGSRHKLVGRRTFSPIESSQQQSTSSTTASHSLAGLVPSSASMIPPLLPEWSTEPDTKKVKLMNESRSCKSSVTETLPVHKPRPSIANKILQEERSYDVDSLIDDIFHKFKDLLKESLTEVLRIEMQSIYEELWLLIVYKKPPWSLMDILLSMQKHWRAVFGMVLGRQNLDLIENLIRYTTKVKINRICDVKEMLHDGCAILSLAKGKPDYRQVVSEAYTTMTALRELCSQVMKENVNVSSILSLDQYLLTKVKSNSPVTVPVPTSSTSSKSCVVITADDFKKPVINTNHSNIIVSSKHSMCTTNQQSSTPNYVTTHSNIHSASSPALPARISSVIVPSESTVQANVPSANIQSAHVLPANFPPASIPQDSLPSVIVPSASVPQDSLPSVIVPPTAPQGDACNVDYQEMIAGERFSAIWNFIFKYCEQFQQSILVNDPTPAVKNEVEPMLKVLVSVALELRKYYVELFELPVDRLVEHEKEFVAFTEICNNFFTQLNAQEETTGGKVTPIHLLVIYSKPEYRQSLTRFRQQLDEMLNMMYLCLQKLCPDD